MDKLTQEFLTESMEGLNRMEQCLTALELRPEDAAVIGEIFRALHTLKGSTGFLGYERVERLAHAGEHLVVAIRSGRVRAATEVISALLQLLDLLRERIGGIERGAGENTVVSGREASLLLALERLQTAPAGAQSKPLADVPIALAVSDKSLRVDVELMNRMMNLVGELVLTRNQLQERGTDQALFPEMVRRLDEVTTELRETVMRARLQPVGQIFEPFPRMVRDLALACGKSVKLEVSGQETALDKSLLRAIKDPLIHALRNAIDHGIEAPEVRVAAGKARQGTVRLRASQRNGSVWIELEDDGAGVGLERVKARAIERGLMSEQEAAAMDERATLQMIFRPGFTTAEKVTRVSGRGVGMDVVRANVEAVGGGVELESHAGTGTLLRLRIPLTLAILPALVVRSGGESVCLPQSAMVEILYVPAAEQGLLADALFSYHRRLIPVVRLNALLGFEEHTAGDLYVMVLEVEGCRYALAADSTPLPQEVVVKPLAAGLRETGLFQGVTVLGSGDLALVLDVAAIAVRAGLDRLGAEQREENRADSGEAADPQFVVFRTQAAPANAWEAVPLEAVEQVESVPLERVEYIGAAAVLREGAGLVELEDPFGVLAAAQAGSTACELTVLRCRRADQVRVGLVVSGALDVAPGRAMPASEAGGEGRLLLVKDRVTPLRRGFCALPDWPEVA